MLWMKGWYETRIRLLVVAGATVLICAIASSDSTSANAGVSAQGLDATTLIGASVLAAAMLAGAGIKTQAGGFRPSKGLHGSMYYTLTLPVSRVHLLSVRASIGLIETALIHTLVCGAALLARPALRLTIPPADLLKHNIGAFFCVGAVYFLGVFFATFLDDYYQMMASVFSLLLLIVILNRMPLPASFNRLLLLSQASPLITHTMPWVGITALVALSATLFLFSMWIVKRREY